MSAAVEPMHEAAIRQYAKQLRLPTVGGQFTRLAGQAVKEKQSHVSYLEALLEAEVEERSRKAMARRVQEARFPAVKTLEEFDFQCASHIPATLIRSLSEGGYLARKEPIIFLGDTGTGKTHLGDRAGGGSLPPAETGAVYDGGGDGDRTDRSSEPCRVDAGEESLDALRLDRDRRTRIRGDAGHGGGVAVSSHRRTRRTSRGRCDDESAVFGVDHEVSQCAVV